ncbi:MAG: hypothetical protein QG601_1903, partial [Pseudomonadota bacterium]|nr:hypothetical protein [Pseudomonadota bacterium]
MENRSGLAVGALVTHADGFGERAAALAMLDAVPASSPRTVVTFRRNQATSFPA